MPDGERTSTTSRSLRTSALHVVVLLFAACLAWWFWGDVAGADEVGEATGPEAGAVDEPPSATGLDVAGDDLPAVVPVPDPAPAPVPPADVEPTPPALPPPPPVADPVPVLDDEVVVDEPHRSERSVDDDRGDVPADDGWEWVDQEERDDGSWDDDGWEGDEWIDPDSLIDPGDGVEWVDPELGDPDEGGVDLPPTEVLPPDQGFEAGEATEVEHTGTIVEHRGEVAERGDVPGSAYLPDGSAEDLVAHARRLQVTRQSLALLAGEMKHTAKPLPATQPKMTSPERPPTKVAYIVRTGTAPGARPARPVPAPVPQVPINPPPALPPGATGSSGGGAMGSGHGPFDPSQLLERARLWASAVGGAGALGGAQYQHQAAWVEAAPAGVPGGRPAFTPD